MRYAGQSLPPSCHQRTSKFGPGEFLDRLSLARRAMNTLMIADTTKSLANLEIIGVREMGRKCLLMTSTGFCLGMGTTSASFQDGGSCCSAKLQLRMEVTG